MKDQLYLDHAAATPVDARVLKAMQPFFSAQFYNPSATYQAARNVKQALETARAKVAQTIGARPAEIIFTAGGTEANNLAVRGVLEQFPGSNAVVSAIEHESVLAPVQLYKHHLAPVAADGVADVPALTKLINDKTVLVSVMYANNEVGTIQPIREIAHVLKQIRQARRAVGNQLPLYLHTDAAQAANYLDLHVAQLGVDLMTLNSGKIYGPKQSGALYVAAQVQLKPQILGGGQERGQRSGTENVAASIGFAEALSIAQDLRHDEAVRLAKLQQLFFDLLKQELPRSAVNGSRKHRLPNNIHVTLRGSDNERLLLELEQAGILAAAGSACSASSEEPSHVLKALGKSDEEAQASLRFTMGRDTTESDIHATVNALAHLVDSKR